MKALLHRAFDLGINLFDTAREYLDSEVILGKALEDLPRADVVVSTKFGAVLATDSGVQTKSAAEVIETVEASLSRLKLSEIDVVMVGGLLTPESAAVVLEEQVPALERLRRQGKVRHVGSSEASSSDGTHDWLRHALPSGRLRRGDGRPQHAEPVGPPQPLPRLRGPQRRRDEHLHQPESDVGPAVGFARS